MSPETVRMTTSTFAVLQVLADATPDDPVYGLRICEQAALGSGTVYPILDRLERAGWIVGEWEAEQPSGRPKRRTYRLTGVGRAAHIRALAAREARRGQRRWLPGPAGARREAL